MERMLILGDSKTFTKFLLPLHHCVKIPGTEGIYRDFIILFKIWKRGKFRRMSGKQSKNKYLLPFE